MLVIAHRGASGTVPENTQLAISSALCSADIVEIDVQLTKDGEVVLFHDRTFERIDGDTKGIGDYTVEELLQKDVGKYFHEEYHGMRIPDLKSTLMIFDNYDFIIELKPQKNRDPSSRILEEKVLNILDDLKFDFYDGYISVRDFETYHYLIEHGKYRVGVMQKKRTAEEFLKELNEVQAPIAQIRWKNFDEKHIKILLDNVAEVYAYPGDYPRVWDLLLRWDVDGILTNYPSALEGYLSLINGD